MASYHGNKKRGFSLVEAVASIGIAATFATFFLVVLTNATKISLLNLDTFRAEAYLIGSIEKVRDIERHDWAEIYNSACASPNPCHIEESGGAWDIVSGSETLDNSYTQSVYIEEVRRDQIAFPNTIVDSGGYLDTSTKKVRVELSWNSIIGPRTKEVEILVHEI